MSLTGMNLSDKGVVGSQTQLDCHLLEGRDVFFLISVSVRPSTVLADSI